MPLSFNLQQRNIDYIYIYNGMDMPFRHRPVTNIQKTIVIHESQ